MGTRAGVPTDPQLSGPAAFKGAVIGAIACAGVVGLIMSLVGLVGQGDELGYFILGAVIMTGLATLAGVAIGAVVGGGVYFLKNSSLGMTNPRGNS